MTRDDIIRMAREAGFRAGHIELYSSDPMPFVAPCSATDCMPELVRFAAIVAAAERAKLYALPGAQPAPSIPDDVMRDAKRYRFLRAAKNIPISTEAARDPIVYDAAIDAAMLAAALEAKP